MRQPGKESSMISKTELERLLIEHNWQRRESFYFLSYHKNDIRVDLADECIFVEYYSGESSIEHWLESASISLDVDYEDMDWDKKSPHQVLFTGGTLKI